jgi:hypothetical protein
MGLLDECEATKRLATNQNIGQHLFRPVDQVDGAYPSEVKPYAPGVRLTFAEDFFLEHSFPSQHIGLTYVPLSSETASRELLDLAEGQGFPALRRNL